MYKYYFHIIDREFGEYDFNGYFIDHYDADEFIKNHEKDGNVVIMVSPYCELVPIDECPAIYANAIREAIKNC